VLSAVEAAGQTDNTLIFFLSDNGACAEFNSQGKSKDLFGNLADTWESYRLSWANASSTPFREYKHWIHEGGIRTPLIVHWPRGVDPKLDGSFVRQPGHLVDIMATCIDVSGANYPQTGVKPLRGTSLQAHFSGGDNGRGPIFWEHEANMGMRDGAWKLVAKTPANEPFSEERLELYNMDDDPSELNNLAARYPERVKQMYAAWTAWGNEAGIFPLDSRDWGKRQRAMRRDANSEFDYNLGSWRLINRRDLVRFSVDHSGKLSGPNSARIEVLQTGERPANALMALVFPPEGKRPFHLSFQAAANRQTDLIVRIENHEKPAVKIANHTFSIGPDAQTFEIDTSAVEMKGDYQLAFYFGTNPAGDQIWIDAINLKPE
jgi:arylsulfatase